MRKEVAVAILLGSVLGLALAFGIWRANKVLRPQTPTTESTPSTSQDADQTKKKNTGTLFVTTPENNSVVNEDKIIVQGSTTPYATIVIVANTGEIISQAKQDGSFSEEIKLSGGPNEIRVLSYDKEGNKSEQTLVIVYSTEFPKKEQ